jgi:hypothetical protein
MTRSVVLRSAFAATVVLFAMPTDSRATPTPKFPAQAPWYSDISTYSPDPASARMIDASIDDAEARNIVIALGVDFSMHVLETAAKPVSRLPLIPTPEYFRPDCETDFDVPVPAGGAIEGVQGYRCSGQDCHLLIVDGHTLYEGFATTIDADGVHATCMVRWRLDRVYPEDGRGDQCTSADAAGFPIAPLMFNADEVAEAARTGSDLGHALRFILPNASMRTGVYVHPATHAGRPSGGMNAIPYGARLRLKHAVPVERFNSAAQVVLRTLRNYGAFVADGGLIPLTAQSDRDTKTKWADLHFDENTLRTITLADFEVMPLGSARALTYDCRRNEAP